MKKKLKNKRSSHPISLIYINILPQKNYLNNLQLLFQLQLYSSFFVANLSLFIIKNTFSFLHAYLLQIGKTSIRMYVEAQQHNFKSQRPKSDIVYYKAFETCYKNTKVMLIFKSILSISMVALFIINYLNDKLFSDLTRGILVNLATSVLGVVIKVVAIRNIYSNNLVFLSLAEIQYHAVIDEIVYNTTRIEDCVSTKVFVANQNLNESDLDDATKKSYTNAALATFKRDISIRYRGIASAQRFHSALSGTTIIYSIILLSSNDLSTLNITILSIYVSLVGLSEFILIIGLILVALVPLLCLAYCIITCCSKKDNNAIVNAQLKKATMQDIIKVDGGCSICFQNYAQQEQIYILPCSDKHIFHRGCLENWVKIKQNCPNCRSAVPMRLPTQQPQLQQP